MKRVSILIVACVGCGGGGATSMSAPAYSAQAAPPQLAQLGIGVAEGTSICPGSATPVQFVVTATTRDGQRLATGTNFRGGIVWNEEHGLPHERFRITPSHGGVTPIAIYQPPAAPLALAETQAIDVRVDDVAQPGLFATARIPVDFKCGAVLALRGRAGGQGVNGSSGQMGEPGATVDVAVGQLTSQAHGDLILARVDGPTGRLYYVLQPGGAPLTIDLTGGDGGRGGAGMRASVGYTRTDNYGDREDNTLSYEGPPGPGGAGGAGGTATIHIDGGDRLLAAAVRVLNGGGRGGPAGENRRGVGAFEHVTAQSGDGAPGQAGLPVRVLPEDPASLFADELAQGFPIVRKMPPAAAKASAKTARK